MRSKQNRTFWLGLILNFLACCCATVAAVTRSLPLPVLTSLTAQSTAPAPAKPLPPPARWLGLIGEYGPDDDILIILEKDGRLWASFKRAEPEPLDEITRNVFEFLSPGAHALQQLIFERNRSRRASQVAVDAVTLKR